MTADVIPLSSSDAKSLAVDENPTRHLGENNCFSPPNASSTKAGHPRKDASA